MPPPSARTPFWSISARPSGRRCKACQFRGAVPAPCNLAGTRPHCYTMTDAHTTRACGCCPIVRSSCASAEVGAVWHPTAAGFRRTGTDSLYGATAPEWCQGTDCQQKGQARGLRPLPDSRLHRGSGDWPSPPSSQERLEPCGVPSLSGRGIDRPLDHPSHVSNWCKPGIRLAFPETERGFTASGPRALCRT